MLFNQVLPVLGHESPVNRFEWSNGEAEGSGLKRNIQVSVAHQSDKCLMVWPMLQMIDMG